MRTLFDLSDTTVVVTGAAGQLGKVISLGLKSAGANIIGCDIAEAKPEYVDDYFLLDISCKAAVEETFEEIHSKHKGIDALINNAGVSTFDPFEDRPEDQFDWVMDVNLKGTFQCIQSYVKHYDQSKQPKGSIVNVASIFGVVSPDFRNYTDCERKNSEVYGATKAGVIQMTKYFAVHLAQRNIRVNAISPGGIFNPDAPQGEDFVKNYSFRTPMNRMARAEEMVGAIIYFCSDAASYTTGQNLTIDGGLTAW